MFNQFDSIVNQYLSVFDNEYASAGLSLFLALYAGLAAPRLPENIARLFDNNMFKFVIFFLIVYSSRKNPTIATIAAIGVMVSLMTLERYNANRRFAEMENGVQGEMPEFQTESEEESVPLGIVQENDNGIPEELNIEEQNNGQPEKQSEEQDVSGCSNGSCQIVQATKHQTANYTNAHLARKTESDIGSYDPNVSYAAV